MKPGVPKRISVAWLLNLLLPGLGHALWREWLFGLFIFLIMLIAVVLFVVTLLVPLSAVVKVLLLGLPLVFYLFSFVDLARTVRMRRSNVMISSRRMLICLAVGIAYQFLSPSAPLNIGLNNLPELYRQSDSRLTPLFHRGDLLEASHMSYFVKLMFFERPIMHSLPQRYDIVRFEAPDKVRHAGVVLGRSGESIEMAEGVLVVNGLPDLTNGPEGISLTGDCPLTVVRDYSILVATMNSGAVDKLYQVPFSDIVGKVSRLP
ncbi:MAG: hypothetical protein AB1644_00535 [Candidatus Zixiibacteriota bacterium]